jgi:MFS family permease
VTLVSALISSSRRRVLTGQVFVKLVLFATYTGMISLLLPTEVAELQPSDKVAALATVSSIALGISAIAQPLIGALSDRTSTRLGRRRPWMVAGALVGGLAVGAIGGAPSLVLLSVLWAVGLTALRGIEVSTDAYLVDAFPAHRRGFAAGIVGLAIVVGTASGSILTGSLVARPARASWILAASVVLAVLVFSALIRDTSPPPSDRRRRNLIALVRSLQIAIAAHPDFIKVLLWQVGFSISYGTVFAYLLYIFTDLIGTQKVEAAHLIAFATVLGGIGAAVSVAVSGWLSDRIGRRRVFILLGNALIIVGDLVLLARPTVAAALATAALFGLGLGLSISCGRALASQVLPNPTDGAAAGLGVLNTATSIGQAAAPVIGALAIGLGGYSATFIASIVGAVACSFAVGLVKSVR